MDQIQRYGINTLANLRNDYKGTVDDVRSLFLQCRCAARAFRAQWK